MLTDKQKELRKLGLGGSDLPIIFGLSTYKTPYVLFLEKLGLIESDWQETEQQYWGHRLEPVIRDHFALKHGVTIEVPDSNAPPLQHPMFDFMLGNIDGYIVEWDAILEIKCSDKFMRGEWGEEGSDVIPMQYLVQVAHYCAVKNCNKAIIAVLIGGNEYREFTYLRDHTLEGQIMQAAINFWRAVQAQEAPETVNIDDLKIKYSMVKEFTIVECNAEIAKHVSQLAEVKAKKKELDKIEEHYKFEIMKYMEHAECLINETGQPLATWKANKKGVRSFLLKGV